jgi:hypothetical protein
MTTIRTCPDWPDLMELAPNLQFKHYSATEAYLPAEVLMKLQGVDLETVELCADLDHNVYYAPHTDPGLVEALQDTHFYELQTWVDEGRGEL